MKKLGLLFATMLLGVTFASASEKTFVKPTENLDINSRYLYSQPVIFIERGVEFMIFPDGSFDFNTHTRSINNGGDFYFKSSNNSRRQHAVNVTFGAPRTVSVQPIRYSQPRSVGVLIEHDRDGKVRRIGNVFINYDRFGRIKRAGSVYMSYQKGHGRLIQVGGLKVRYNRFGQLIYSHGSINQHNHHAFSNYDYDYDDDDDDDWYDDYDDDDWYDDDMYYYRSKKDKDDDDDDDD